MFCRVLVSTDYRASVYVGDRERETDTSPDRETSIRAIESNGQRAERQTYRQTKQSNRTKH